MGENRFEADHIGESMMVIAHAKVALLGTAALHMVLVSQPAAAQDATQTTSPAVATSGPSATGSQEVASATSPTTPTSQDIIVTANKTSQRLQDVPLSVSVIDTGAAAARNQTRLADYVASVPGLSIQPGNQSAQTIVVRGITTGLGNPSVGITVDDVPFGASSVDGGGFQVPDFDPGDLKQIEVLKGPQGTLYGASSLSGLIKFETVDPSTSEVSGSVFGGLSAVHGTGDLGLTARAAINVPLSTDVAVRVSGFHREDAGWLDNAPYSESAVNAARANGGRFSLLIRPAQGWRVKLGAMYQQIKGGSTDDEHLDLGAQEQAYLPDSTKYNRKVQAYSANIDGQIGPVSITSVTGYNVNQIKDGFDLSFALGAVTAPTFGVDGILITNSARTRKFSQEVRGITKLGSRIDVQVGGFYTTERGGVTQSILAADPKTGVPVAEVASLVPHVTYREYAVFGTLTARLTDRIDVQIGGRKSWIRQTYSRIDTGLLVPVLDGTSSPFLVPERATSADVFTYSFSPRFKVNENLMLYARAASGYRAGGTNAAFGVPLTYDPDRTYSYEVGAKGKLLNGKVTFDGSLYYIDWRDIQLTLMTPSFIGYRGNAGKAKSQGFEVSVDVHPISGLTLGGWLSVNDAKLAENAPATATISANKGSRLPFSAPITWNVHAEQQFALSSRVVAGVGGQVAYVDRREGIFTADGTGRQPFPAYTTLQLSANITIDGSTRISAYANNVTNSRGQLNTGFPTGNSFLGTTFGTSIYRVRPREVGLTIGTSF